MQKMPIRAAATMISSINEMESLQDAYRRLVVDCIAKAIAALDESHSRDVAIHTIRKQCKQARALIRLFHNGSPLARREACGFFRDLGRSLSAARDAKVALDVHESLLERFGALLDPVPGASVREQLERALCMERGDAREQPLGGQDLRRQLLAARVRARRAVVAGTAEVELKEALVRAYRRARQAAQAALDCGQAPDFHEARKRAKDYWYQLEIVARRWPAVAVTQIAPVRRLTELLGDAQDCEVYAAALENIAAESSAPTTELLLALAEHRARTLREEALRLCPQVFGEKPKQLAVALGLAEPLAPLHRAAG